MSIDPKNEAVKTAIKEGLREWLDEMLADFGRWSLKGLAALAIAGVVWLALTSSGWRHP